MRVILFVLQVITVQAVINNVNKTFTLNNLSSVGSNGIGEERLTVLILRYFHIY